MNFIKFVKSKKQCMHFHIHYFFSSQIESSIACNIFRVEKQNANKKFAHNVMKQLLP